MKTSLPAPKTFHFVVLVLILSVVLLLGSSASVAAQVETLPSSESVVPSNTAPAGEPICGPTRYVSGEITTDTWWEAGYVYVLDGDVTVKSGATLRIDASVIKAKGNTKLQINGRLLAVGTASFPHYFTSWKDDTLCGDTNGDGGATVPATGDWGWIQFNADSNSDSVLSRAVVRYGGYCRNYNCNYYGESHAPIRLVNVMPTLANITFTSNYRNAVEIPAQSWSTSNWNNTSIIYWLYGDNTVPLGSVLTLAPGLKVKVAGSSKLLIDGKLLADGTQAAPVLFTSEKDDTVCGVGAADEPICDTNNDQESSTPATGDWGWIQFNAGSSSTSVLRRAVVRYGGYCRNYNCNYYGESHAPIRLVNVMPTLANITFTSNYRNAVEIPAQSWSTSNWNNTSIIYWLYGDNTVPLGSVLTLAPGLKVKVAGSSKLLIDGKLLADGTQAAPVLFTSEKDDTVCGVGAADEPICDTNNDQESSTPATGDWGWIQFNAGSSSTSVLRRAVVRYGGYCRNYNCNYYGESHAPIRLVNVMPTLANITFTSNYRNAVEIPAQSWSTSNWNNTSIIYWLYGDNTVPLGSVLTLAPGLKVKVAGSSKLLIDGKLLADGTQAAPVLFTSEKDDTVCGVGAADEPICDTNNDQESSTPATGDWGWIQFNAGSSSTSVLRRAVVRYGGYCRNYNCNYYGESHAPIRLVNVMPTLANITFTSNYRNAAEITPQDWNTSTWNSASVILWLGGDVTFPRGSALTVGAGVKIKIPGNVKLNIGGKLVGNGTDAEPILIVSEKDDTVCGIGVVNESVCDTNNDDRASQPAIGDWGWIQLESASDPTSILNRVVIRHGGYCRNYNCAYYGESHAAVRLAGVSPTITYVRFDSNYSGLDALDGARPILTCNDFQHNQSHGIYNDRSTSTIVAEGQWWNSPSGPSHSSNPGGTGDRVSNGIDFTPWATSPCTAPTYSISGRVKDASNNGIPGVTISDGVGHSVTTDNNGNYSLGGLVAGMYALTPHKNGYSFNPISTATDVPPSKTGVDFTGTPLTYSIAGRVTTSSGNPISGVIISDDRGHSATTDADGNYTLTGLTAGMYALTPGRSGYTFSPASIAVDVPPNRTEQNFIGTPPVTVKPWTLMYYLAADGDININYHLDILKRYQGNANFSIAVMYDGTAQGDSRYYAISDNISFIQKGELNTGDPATLTDFVNWAKATLPSTHTALVIVSHGSGLSGVAIDDQVPGGCTPSEPRDCLNMSDLRWAAQQIVARHGKTDIVFMHACLMATVESAYQLRDFANYYVASEDLLKGYWPLGYLEGLAQSNPTPESLARSMATDYAQFWGGHGYEYTVSAVRLAKLPYLTSQINQLAGLLRDRMAGLANFLLRASVLAPVQRFNSNNFLGIEITDELIDLYDFARLVKLNSNDQDIRDAAQAVMDAIYRSDNDTNQYVLYNSSRSGSCGLPTCALERSYGVSIFFPDRSRSFYIQDNLDFATGTSWGGTSAASVALPEDAIGWGPMLVEYVRQTNPSAPDNPNPPALVAPQIIPLTVYLPLMLKRDGTSPQATPTPTSTATRVAATPTPTRTPTPIAPTPTRTSTPNACPQSGGVIVYRNANFDCNGQGEGIGWTLRSAPGWQNLPAGINDAVSSVRVPAGWSVTFYEHTDRGGGWACRQADDPDFTGDTFSNGVLLNDSASSFYVSDTPCAFTADSASALLALTDAKAAWGDYDNDGDLDLALAGYTGTSQATRLYRNDAGVLHEVSAAFADVSAATLDWGDYDNDGDLDLLLTGWSNGFVATVYRNDNGNFFDINAPFVKVAGGAARWGDYDNDGDLDVLMVGDDGAQGISKVYRNDGGTFTDIGAPLLGVGWGASAAWGDYDNDGDLDIVLAGYLGGDQRATKIYRNNDGQFTDIDAGLRGVSGGEVAWGDYDNDGDLDLVVVGWADNIGGTAQIYRNDGGVFTDIQASLWPVCNGGAASWADYDNDGDLDLLVAGDSWGASARIYRNEGGDRFENISAPLMGVRYGSVAAWADYDKDGDLDVLLAGSDEVGQPMSRLYRNVAGFAPNTPPVAPTGLGAEVAGDRMTLRWSRASDGRTAQQGLNYNLRLGTQAGGVQRVSPHARTSDGWRRVVKIGNVGQRQSWTIHSLPPGTYYWSVQAIDSSFTGSQFAAEQSFTVSCSPSDGVVLYEHPNYGGRCMTFTGDDDDFNNDNFNDMASSIRFFGSYRTGWEAVVYEHSYYGGVSSVFQGDDPDFGDDTIGHDWASSVQIHRSGPTAYWRLDEGNGATASDATGDGNTGTLINGPTWSTGKINGALSFDGIDDYVRINRSILDTSKDYTVAAWVMLREVQAFRTAVSQEGAEISGFYLQTAWDGRFNFGVHVADASSSDAVRVTAPWIPQANQWYHLVGVHDSVHDQIKLYVDGVLIGTQPYSAGWNATGNTLIGRAKHGGNPVDFWPGKIDDVYLFDHVLSDSDVLTLYKQAPGNWITVLNEDFEDDFPGAWQVSSDDGQYYWGKRSCLAYAGTYSGWAVGGGPQGSVLACNSSYPNNAASGMGYGPFSLTGATAAEIRFKLWLNTEWNGDVHDSFCVWASRDGGNFGGVCHWGYSGGWSDQILDLTGLAGEPNVWIAFGFYSNSSVNQPVGAYIDNVIVRKCVEGTCSASSAQDRTPDTLFSAPAQRRSEP